MKQKQQQIHRTVIHNVLITIDYDDESSLTLQQDIALKFQKLTFTEAAYLYRPLQADIAIDDIVQQLVGL